MINEIFSKFLLYFNVKINFFIIFKIYQKTKEIKKTKYQKNLK